MRGVPASGKSTRARELVQDDMNKIFSTDEYFEKDPRGYRAAWAHHKLGRAHQWNERRVEDAMRQGVNPIVLDNTNISIKEVKPYVKMAYEHGYDIQIEESTDDLWQNKIKPLFQDKIGNEEELTKHAETLAARNVHGVPQHTILNKFKQYTPYTVEDIHNYLGTPESR